MDLYRTHMNKGLDRLAAHKLRPALRAFDKAIDVAPSQPERKGRTSGSREKAFRPRYSLGGRVDSVFGRRPRPTLEGVRQRAGSTVARCGVLSTS